MPAKKRIYNVDGASVEMYAVDARAAVEGHPGEWSYTRFPKAETEAKAKADEHVAKAKAETEAKK